MPQNRSSPGTALDSQALPCRPNRQSRLRWMDLETLAVFGTGFHPSLSLLRVKWLRAKLGIDTERG